MSSLTLVQFQNENLNFIYILLKHVIFYCYHYITYNSIQLI